MSPLLKSGGWLILAVAGGLEGLGAFYLYGDNAIGGSLVLAAGMGLSALVVLMCLTQRDPRRET